MRARMIVVTGLEVKGGRGNIIAKYILRKLSEVITFLIYSTRTVV